MPSLFYMQAFGIYTPISGETLTPAVTFHSLSLFNQLAMPLFLLPFSLFLLVNAVVSSRRLGDFFMAPEVEGIGKEEDTDDAEECEEVL